MTNDPNDPNYPEDSEDLPENDADDQQGQGSSENAFDLSVPTGNMETPEREERPEIEKSATIHTSVPVASEESYKSMGWKGIDDEEEDDEEPPLSFAKKEKIPEDELDMTPMVDVTFLLLIFFMVTASFTLQKSIPQPPASSDEASLNVQDEEDVKDYVEVIIDQNDSYYVTSRGDEEREAPSETEMRSLVKDAVDTFGPERMVITASVDATQARLIAACDAAQSNNLAIEVKTTDVEY